MSNAQIQELHPSKSKIDTQNRFKGAIFSKPSHSFTFTGMTKVLSNWVLTPI